MKDLEIWEQVAEKWKAGTGSQTVRSQHFNKAISTLISDAKRLKILDAGCGDGVFSKMLSDRGAEVIGIDGSKKMVEIARQNYHDLKFEIADLLKPLSFPDQNFDIVLANMVLMHLADINIFLKEAKRVLRPNGHLIFSVLHPCFNNPTMKLYKSLWDKLTFKKPAGLVYDYYTQGETRRFEKNLDQKVTHYHRTLEEYSKLLKNSGFIITEIMEPHELSEEYLRINPQFEYTTRMPRFIFFKCQTN